MRLTGLGKLPSLRMQRLEQFFIYAAILVALGGLLSRSLIFPELKNVSAVRFQLKSQQNLLKMKAEGQIQQNQTMLNDKIQQLKMTLAEIKESLFSIDEATDFLGLLPQILSQTGNALISMKPRDMRNLTPVSANQVTGAETEGSYMQMPVQITIRGKYNGIISFFRQLKEYKHLATVSEINVKTATEDPAEVEARFVLNLYVH